VGGKNILYITRHTELLEVGGSHVVLDAVDELLHFGHIPVGFKDALFDRSDFG
jgi:hypothetical protein